MDFFQEMLFGMEIMAHGEKWQSVLVLQNRYHLAVKLGATLPATCHVVQEDEKPKAEIHNTN